MTVLVPRLLVVGVGLIGGSFALALKAAGAVGRVVGAGRTMENLQEALALGVIDSADTLPDAAKGADLVLLALPVRAMAPAAKKMAPVLKPGAIVTDAGSTKEIVLGELFAHLPAHVQLVGGHPIAGSEQTGAGAARADLFQGHRTILTPDHTTDPAALELVKKLWEAAGAQVEFMDPHRHDLVLGAVSHLPHLAAYALIDTLMEWDRETPMLRFSAGGLKDFTRVAASSPEMWRDICLDNREALLLALDRLTQSLGAIREEVAEKKGSALLSRFERSREARKKIGGENP